jgi:hypothetical protein
MSAIKTHEFFNIVGGDSIDFHNDEGQQTLQVSRMMVSRQNPTLCQLFAHAENKGSLSSRETKVYHGQINAYTKTVNSEETEFSVKAKVGDEFKTLILKTVKSNNSECCIS